MCDDDVSSGGETTRVRTPCASSTRRDQLPALGRVSSSDKKAIQILFSELGFWSSKPRTNVGRPTRVGGYMRGGLSACGECLSAYLPSTQRLVARSGPPRGGPASCYSHPAGTMVWCWVGRPKSWRNRRVGSHPSRGAPEKHRWSPEPGKGRRSRARKV